MKLENGTYRTKAGSTVTLSGTHGGIASAVFDWLEEDGACCDCQCDPYPEHWGNDEYGNPEFRLTWFCGVCDGGSARLMPVSDSKDNRPTDEVTK